MKKVICFMLTALIAINVFARLGETKDQCDRRYGKPKIEKTVLGRKYAVYYKSGFVVGILFYSTKINPTDTKAVEIAGMISFAKLNKNHPVYKQEAIKRKSKFVDITRYDCGRTRLKADQISKLLGSNTQGSRWEWVAPKKNLKSWEPFLEKKIEKIEWNRNGDTPGKAYYLNIYPHNMLVIQTPAFYRFSWEKVEEAEKAAKNKKKKKKPVDEDSLQGF